MIDLETIEREINEIETRRDTTYSTCERLAWLYVVRDHLVDKYTANMRTDYASGSEFIEACSGVNYMQLLQILDEHMQGIKIVHPKEYETVISKISRLGKG